MHNSKNDIVTFTNFKSQQQIDMFVNHLEENKFKFKTANPNLHKVKNCFTVKIKILRLNVKDQKYKELQKAFPTIDSRQDPIDKTLRFKRFDHIND